MHYLLLGEDSIAKSRRIETIKSGVLTLSESKGSDVSRAVHFDYQVLYADKLSAEELKKELITLPVVSSKRLIVICRVHALNTYNKALILEFLEREKSDYVEIIFDTQETKARGPFLKKISEKSKVEAFGKDSRPSVFDMTNAIQARKPREAISLLRELLDCGDHPLQIMGALVWYWGRNKSRVSREKFHKGMKYLQEADLNIKRTRLTGDNAVELVVVKLYLLTIC